MRLLLITLLLTGCATECVYDEYGETTGRICYGREAAKYSEPSGLASYNLDEYEVNDIQLSTYSEVREKCEGYDGCITIDRLNKKAEINRVYGADRVLEHELYHITHGDFHLTKEADHGVKKDLR